MVNKKNTKDKTIPVGNYIKLALVIFVTLFVVLLFRNWYVSKINYELNIPIIRDSLLNEVNADEVYSYVRENENAVLYICVVNDEKCRQFETEFNKIIINRKLENVITYLNITKTNNKSSFIKEFNKFYDTNLLGYPSIVIFGEGEVKSTITVKTGKELEINNVIKFLDSNNVVSTNL